MNRTLVHWSHFRRSCICSFITNHSHPDMHVLNAIIILIATHSHAAVLCSEAEHHILLYTFDHISECSRNLTTTIYGWRRIFRPAPVWPLWSYKYKNVQSGEGYPHESIKYTLFVCDFGAKRYGAQAMLLRLRRYQISRLYASNV